VLLQNLKRLLDQITQVQALALGVVDAVANVDVAALKDIQNWKQLALNQKSNLLSSKRRASNPLI